MNEEKYVNIEELNKKENKITREDVVNTFNNVLVSMDNTFQETLDCVARCKIVRGLPEQFKDTFSIYILVSNPNVLDRRVAIEYFDAVVNTGIQNIESMYGDMDISIDNYDVVFDVYEEMFDDDIYVDYDEFYSKINLVVNNRHNLFKSNEDNKLYRFEGFAYNTFEESWEVYYRALYGFENMYTKPVSEFFGKIAGKDGHVCDRFEPCSIN